MKIDLTCPVELWQYAMPTQENSECTFVMNNLSDKVVTSVQVTLSCFDENDELLFRQTERVQGLKAGVGDRFTIVILPSEWNAVEGVDLVIEKVWFDDATIWRKGNAPLAYFTPNAIAPGRALDELRFVAGKDAVGYPQLQDQVWVCVCGRANHVETQRCCRCERRRDAVFASFNRENVSHVIAAHEQKLAQAARKAREDNNLLQENQEKQRAAKRRRRKLAVRWTVTGGIAAIAAVVIVVWGIPFVRYQTAQDLLNDGHYDQAAAAFADMRDYRDAAAQILECDYLKAQSLLNEGGEEALAEAEKLFTQLADYKESAELKKQASYGLGEVYLAADRYEDAAEKYQALGDYRDCADKLKETTYRQAKALMESSNYQAARVLFSGLNGYSDAADQVQVCSYELAQGYMENGQYQKALDELYALGDYEDSDEIAKQALYALAEEHAAAGEYEEAGNKYLMAGDYSDAKAKANDCIYRLAQEKKAAGEYEKAMELFSRIPDYLDSEGQADSCLYEQAEAMIENEEYAHAAALLELIPNYADAQAKLDECRFLQAEIALEAGDAEQAERLLDAIVDYRGSETRLKKVRYQLAEAAYENGQYADALQRYELLKNYRNSATRIKQCRYALANDALEKKQYEEAIALFEQLGSYKDTKTLLKEAQYQRALKLRENGNVDGAIEVLSELDDKRAKSILDEIAMEQAAKLAENGDYPSAAEIYASIKTEEAQERYNACQYVLAEQLYEQGDLTGAGDAFHHLGSYQDAKERSEACYNAYYGQVAEQARGAMEQMDYVQVIRLLNAFDLNTLSKTYDDLPDLYKEACYQYAEELYRSGKPYDAIPFYQLADEYRDAAKEKLGRRVYLILGDWESATGKTASFRMDGTCDLMGETLHYRVSNFSVYTGADAENMTITHKLSAITEEGMSLRDVRDGQDVVYKFSRVGGFELPDVEMKLPEETAAEAETEILEPEPTEDADEPEA